MKDRRKIEERRLKEECKFATHFTCIFREVSNNFHVIHMKPLLFMANVTYLLIDILLSTAIRFYDSILR